MIDTLDIKIEKANQSKLSEVDFQNLPFARVYSDHMFVSQYRSGSWDYHSILPYGDISISPANAALHYGQSIFEGMKAYKSAEGDVHLFRPLDNYQRMNVSAERMAMPKLPEEVFMNGLCELLHIDKAWVPDIDGTSLYIRPVMFATDNFIGVRPSDDYTFIIFTCPVGAYYPKPVKVKIETHYTRAAAGGTGYAKAAGNYAGSYYPAKMAQDQGYDQLIWTDAKEHKYIEESGTMNVMFLIDDTLLTAPTSDTILKGVTRDSVLILAKDWGVKVEERKVTVDEIIDAAKSGSLKEAFGAGTAATIAHIDTISHQDTDYQLPDMPTREFSNKVLSTLNDIKLGKIEDKFGWVHKV